MALTLALLNLGPEEILVILMIFLLLFGADKIPQVARQLGKARAELSRAQTEVQKALKGEDERALDEQLKSDASREQHVVQQDYEMFQLRRAAVELGIDTGGKTREELRIAIAEAVAPTKPEPKLGE
ncbi:MAG: twin-arginine translocase TatA/TatE family subunit [Candidatus Thermoplasmatota archaeon]